MNLTDFCTAKNIKAHSKRLFGSINRKKKKHKKKFCATVEEGWKIY